MNKFRRLGVLDDNGGLESLTLLQPINGEPPGVMRTGELW